MSSASSLNSMDERLPRELDSEVSLISANADMLMICDNHAQDALKEFRETYTQQEKNEALSKTAKIVETYSDEFVKRCNEGINFMLVFVRAYPL